MADPQPTYFSQVAETFRTTNDQSRRDEALNAGVRTARERAHQLFEDTRNKVGPVANIRVRYENEAGLRPGLMDENPFMNVPQEQFEEAYRSWASSGGTGIPPWERLAVAVKEGWTTNRRLPDTQQWGTTPQRARALWRSRFYYFNIGLDHFIDRQPQPSGDNAPAFLDVNAPDHQVFFERSANSIEAGLAQKIDAELIVSPNPNPTGGFDVRPTSQFYELTLRLVDAYFRENVDQVEGHDPGLGYIRWNMGEARYRNFDTAAQRYSRLYANRKPNGAALTEAEWAFKTPIVVGQWDQPRRNALRFMYFSEVYRLAFEEVK